MDSIFAPPRSTFLSRLRVAAAGLVGAFVASISAYAAPFAGGIVTIVTPASSGSSFDNAARSIAEPLGKIWGVPVVVENRPGASTIIASQFAAKAAPDGRTILLTVTPTIQAPFLYPATSVDPLKAFAPVTQVFDARLWLAVNSKIPAHTVDEFVALARKPGAGFAYGSPGAGSTPHLNTVQLAKQANIELLHVPYKGVSPAVVDLAGGRLASTFASYSDLSAHVDSGTVRVLASTGDGRSPLTPNVPSMEEQGYRDFNFVGFGGFVVPKGTPQKMIDEIAADIHKVIQEPDIQARLTSLGFEPVLNSGPAEFGKLMAEQSAYWKNIIEETGVKRE